MALLHVGAYWPWVYAMHLLWERLDDLTGYGPFFVALPWVYDLCVPITYFLLSVMTKKIVVGPFREGQVNSHSEWEPFRRWLMEMIVTNHLYDQVLVRDGLSGAALIVRCGGRPLSLGSTRNFSQSCSG